MVEETPNVYVVKYSRTKLLQMNLKIDKAKLAIFWSKLLYQEPSLTSDKNLPSLLTDASPFSYIFWSFWSSHTPSKGK